MSSDDDLAILSGCYAEMAACAEAYRTIYALRVGGGAAIDVADEAIAWARALALFSLDVRRKIERRGGRDLQTVSEAERLGALHAVVGLNQIGASFVLLAEAGLVPGALYGVDHLDALLESLADWRALVEEHLTEVPELPFPPRLAAVPELVGGMRGPRALIAADGLPDRLGVVSELAQQVTEREATSGRTRYAGLAMEVVGVVAVVATFFMYATERAAALATRPVRTEPGFSAEALTAAGDLAVAQNWFRHRPLIHSLTENGIQSGLIDWQLGELAATLVALSDPEPGPLPALMLPPEELYKRLSSNTVQALASVLGHDAQFIADGSRRLAALRREGAAESELFESAAELAYLALARWPLQ